MQASRAGVAALALTDHDNTDGIDEAAAAAKKVGLGYLSGVELSTQWSDYRDMHLLGYGFDHNHAELRYELGVFREHRLMRNRRIVENINNSLLAEGRTPLDSGAIEASAAGSIGRPHIARALIKAGYVRSNDEAFDRYLVPCNVPKHFFPVDKAIELIHAAGGVAVLAHPFLISRDPGELKPLIRQLIEFGLDGVEAYHNSCRSDEKAWLLWLAGEYRLLVTGGSDFHGIPDSAAAIGCVADGHRVPWSCFEGIRENVARR